MKLLIVEDEPIARLGLRKTIDWKTLGIDEINEAKNGLEGLSVAQTFNPDIIITDVKMPRMSGVEMIKELRERGSEAEIIILSGYGEFDYAKEAIKYRVSNYLLKPVSNEELLDSLTKIIENLKKKIRTNEVHVMDATNEDYKRRIIRLLIREDYEDVEILRHELTSQGKTLIEKGYFIIGILDNEHADDAKELYEYEEALASIFDRTGVKYLSGIYHQRISFVIEEVDLNQLDNWLFESFELFEKKSDKTISLGVSSLFNGVHEIHKAYDESKNVASNRLMNFVNSVQYFNSTSKRYSANLIRALEIIYKEYNQELSVPIVSEKLNVSDSYLMHLFKKELGITFNTALTNTRIYAAKELLKKGELRVNEIAYEVGYNDEKYFTLVFKKIVGVTPSVYQKENR